MAKFKVGDRVHHHRYGSGTIKARDGKSQPYFVEFDNKHKDLHSGHHNGIYGNVKSCYWFEGASLTAVSKTFKGNK